MATINFLIQSKSDTAAIYVRLRNGRNRDLKVKTNFIIDSEDWSHAKGQPKTLKDEGLKALYGRLTDFRARLLSHFNETDKLEITKQWLRDFVNPPEKIGGVPDKLVEYYGYYAEHKNSSIGYTTRKKLGVQKNLLIRFQQATKTEYRIKDVDSRFKLRLENFCIDENYSRNTISQVIKSIKTICYHAQANGTEVSPQLKSISVKWEKTDKTFLSLEELKKIEDAKLTTASLDNAKDWLLISCETGQRVSDFMRFKKEMIRYEAGKPLIEFTQVKTDKRMTVPLSKKVIAILKKRKGDFPRQISDQKYNEYIKEVCKQAGLSQRMKGSIKNPETERKQTGMFEKWQLVSSHVGRRSFATNNYGKIPTSLLIGATGHSTEKQFLEYIGKSDTQKALQLADYIK